MYMPCVGWKPVYRIVWNVCVCEYDWVCSVRWHIMCRLCTVRCLGAPLTALSSTKFQATLISLRGIPIGSQVTHISLLATPINLRSIPISLLASPILQQARVIRIWFTLIHQHASNIMRVTPLDIVVSHVTSSMCFVNAHIFV